MRRPARLRRHVAQITVMALACATLVGSAPPAHAVLATKDKLLYTTTGTPVPNLVYDKWGNSTRKAGCTTFPGVSMDGQVLARAYITTESYVKLYSDYATHYNEKVAIAKAARPDFSCLQLAQFVDYASKFANEDRATIQALKDSGCAVPNASFWHSWCRLAGWELDPTIGGVQDSSHLVYKSLNLDLNQLCRQPQYVRDPDTDQPYVPPRKADNGLPAYRGPARYAAWHDPGVTLATQNLDGSVNAGLKSGLDSVITAGGFGAELAQLVAGKIGFDEFLQDIFSGATLGFSPTAGGTGAILGMVVTILELIVMVIFDLVIDARNAPVKVGDFTFTGGRAAIDPNDTRPGGGEYGQFVGYGKVQNLAASNDYANWLIDQATQLYTAHPTLYPNPALSAANAIQVQREVARKIAN